MVEMAIVKLVHMAVMANRSVSAVRAMLVGVIGMMLLGAGRHDLCPFFVQNLSGPLVTVALQPWVNSERAVAVPAAGTNPPARV